MGQICCASGSRCFVTANASGYGFDHINLPGSLMPFFHASLAQRAQQLLVHCALCDRHGGSPPFDRPCEPIDAMCVCTQAAS